ncbi:Methyltransferase type 11 [Solidesulfovibrio fructosivorans JJ]]|uniref:Methyltransferase type 11 n=1 Tax=Solidesulfovibrio fructosivorans JJ] TaxID=596151 RepID=E1JXT6_SOLFR|nr:methyltransferase domain-containing protein [Solidesulfovibrio fructosivorans]EFL50859.1 Methyltransferase type 11 [Solidesulfovibrio fructosivorans JJ]]
MADTVLPQYGLTVHPSARVSQNSILLREACCVTIGANSLIEGRLVFERAGGRIAIGERTFLGSASILCANSVTIGSDVLIAFDVVIADHDSHSLHFSERKNDVLFWRHGVKDWSYVQGAPIRVDDKAWIGMRATILKGVHIGEGAVVAACSVVTRDVPPYAVVAGNPARVVRMLDPAGHTEAPNPPAMTWEQAVAWLREQPDQAALTRACYFDDPLLEAVKRYHDEGEWAAVRELLPTPGGKALDVGAGRGIASYALAADGWEVTALEPDPSRLVGHGAIEEIARATGLPIRVVAERGERLPFPDDSFDVVHARQVLHHASDLNAMCRELVRVLKPGGALLATREHVLSKPEDLPAFLAVHPLHRLYGGENAFTLEAYLAALRQAGASIKRVLSPLESPVNTFPATPDQVLGQAAAILKRPAAELGPRDVARASRMLQTPGRLFSFLCGKKRPA